MAAKFKDYDDYIENSNDFAKPILRYLRACVNEACPDVKEEFKWSFPNFTYKGSILCHMAGLKNHVGFGFWLGEIMEDPDSILHRRGNEGMGNLGKITSIEDLPNKKILIKYLKNAAQLTDQGKKLPVAKKKTKKEVVIPEILLDALGRNDSAAETFNNFSPSNKRDYTEWIEGAKTDKTRDKRLEQTIEWLEQGKVRNWKYLK
jgi:uncharacterized protein YdeI (YjbR/CyaY-like superfamily)